MSSYDNRNDYGHNDRYGHNNDNRGYNNNDRNNSSSDSYPQGEVEGTVRSWNHRKGFGFITDIKGLNEDVYFNRKDLPGQLLLDIVPGIGQPRNLENHVLRFSIVLEKRGGKKRATNIQDPSSQATFKSRVRNWNHKNGYGFIDCPSQLLSFTMAHNSGDPKKKDILFGRMNMIDATQADRHDLKDADCLFSVNSTEKGLTAVYVRFPELEYLDMQKGLDLHEQCQLNSGKANNISNKNNNANNGVGGKGGYNNHDRGDNRVGGPGFRNNNHDSSRNNRDRSRSRNRDNNRNNNINNNSGEIDRPGNRKPKGVQPAPGEPLVPEGRHLGYVKSFVNLKYGFILCPHIKSYLSSHEIFVPHLPESPNLKPGDIVTFVFQKDPNPNHAGERPRANEIEKVVAPVVPVVSEPAESNADGSLNNNSDGENGNLNKTGSDNDNDIDNDSEVKIEKGSSESVQGSSLGNNNGLTVSESLPNPLLDYAKYLKWSRDYRRENNIDVEGIDDEEDNIDDTSGNNNKDNDSNNNKDTKNQKKHSSPFDNDNENDDIIDDDENMNIIDHENDIIDNNTDNLQSLSASDDDVIDEVHDDKDLILDTKNNHISSVSEKSEINNKSNDYDGHNNNLGKSPSEKLSQNYRNAIRWIEGCSLKEKTRLLGYLESQTS